MSNKLLHVAAAELRHFFVSPIAWVMFAVFFALTSNALLEAMETVINAEMRGAPQAVTPLLFQQIGVFGSIYSGLLLYIPLLTMGIMSRDRHLGTIHLLMSSPVKASDLVVGKYLALLVVIVVFVALTLVLASVATLHASTIDWPHVLSGLVGMYLLAATYAAVGLFISSLTTHQVVAAIVTVFFLALLSAVGLLGQRYPVINDMAYWLSIAGRADLMMNGLITSKDIFYFVIISVVFLWFTFQRLEAGRKKKASLGTAAHIGLVLFSAFALGHVTSLHRFTAYWDVTHNKVMSLSTASEEALRGIDQPVSISVLVNVLDLRASFFNHEYRRAIERARFERFERFLGPIDVRYVYYYADAQAEEIYDANPGMTNAQIAEKFAFQNRLNFSEFLTQEEAIEYYGLDAERFRTVYLVEANGNRSVFRNFEDSRYYPDEAQITTGFSLLRQDPVRISYITDGKSRSAFSAGLDDHASLLTDVSNRFSLVNQGFSTERISLNRPVPNSTDILVLAAPELSLGFSQFSNLREYISRGGNLLVLLDRPNGLESGFLQDTLGVELYNDTKLSQVKDDFPNDIVFSKVSQTAGVLGYEMPPSRPDWPVLLQDPLLLNQTDSAGFSYVPIIDVPDDAEIVNLNSHAGPSAVLGVAGSRSIDGRQQRVVIVGDADFMSNSVWSMQRPARRLNTSLFLSVFHYLGNQRYPIKLDVLSRHDLGLSANLRDVDRLRLFLVVLVPATIVASGGLLLWRRRRVA